MTNNFQIPEPTLKPFSHPAFRTEPITNALRTPDMSAPTEPNTYDSASLIQDPLPTVFNIDSAAYH